MAVFSSAAKTATCCGGFTYNPITSAALGSKSDRPTACSARTDAVAAPPAASVGHVIVIDPQQPGELAGAPVRTPVRRRLAGLLENPRFHRGGQHRGRLTGVPGLQSGQALRHKPSPPAIDEVAVARDRGFDHRVRGAIGEHQDHARTSRILRADLAAAQTRFELRAFIMREHQRHMARQRTSTASRCTVH